jgi:hypothetical protein
MALMEVETAAHPRADLLRKLAQGRLPPEEVTPLEEHLDDCESCCRFLEQAPDDSFVGRLREARDVRSVDTLVNAVATMSGEGDEPGELADHPRYRLIRLLGRGGMGAVYLADHRHMSRPVALKVINPELLNQRGALPRFQQEVRAAAKLDHPNIVAAHDADHAGGVHFLVMEYVEGQNLADYLSQHGPLPIAQACDIIRQAALGLEHAHKRGMVHRDIKPHNLMLTPSGQVKVLDFGLARLAAEPAGAPGEGEWCPTAELTGVGAVIGSADYIAPEQARDARDADGRSDIYSLGCTLYHLLTNRPPFPEGTAPEKLHRHGADDPCRLTALRPEVPHELPKVLRKMMAKRPEDRYQSAGEVAVALTRFNAPRGRKPFSFRAKALALVALALSVFSLAAAAGVVRLPAGDREIVIETDDPTVEIIVKGERIVRIVDPKTGKAYQLDRNDLTLSLADEPNGLAVTLDGERPLNLKRQGKKIATVRLTNPAVSGQVQKDMIVVGVKQVQIELTLARVKCAAARQLKARWRQLAKNGENGKAPAPGSKWQPIFGINDRDGFLNDLSRLSAQGEAKLINEPRVITQSGRPAWIVSGGEVPILTTSENGIPSVTYKTFGTVVNFLPVVLGNGKIHLEVRPEISKLNPPARISAPFAEGTAHVPGFDIRSAQVAVEIEDGQTLGIGGLIETSINGQESKIPILGDLPLVGPAFTSTTYTETEEEVIILVTPHVVDAGVQGPDNEARSSKDRSGSPPRAELEPVLPPAHWSIKPH